MGELAKDEREESENPRRQPAVAPSAVTRLCRDVGLHGPVRTVAVVGPAGRGLLVRRIQISHHFELAHRLGLSITSNGVREPAVTPRSAPLPARGGGSCPVAAPHSGRGGPLRNDASPCRGGGAGCAPGGSAGRR